jgi:hypothetical protein
MVCSIAPGVAIIGTLGSIMLLCTLFPYSVRSTMQKYVYFYTSWYLLRRDGVHERPVHTPALDQAAVQS